MKFITLRHMDSKFHYGTGCISSVLLYPSLTRFIHFKEKNCFLFLVVLKCYSQGLSTFRTHFKIVRVMVLLFCDEMQNKGGGGMG